MAITDFFEIEQSTPEIEKEKFINHMEFLRAMTNQEHTLYKKWKEVQEYSKYINKAEIVKGNIWMPTDISDKEASIADIKALRPKIVFVDPKDKKQMEAWEFLRVFIHTMEFEQNPGRFLRFFLIDEVTGKYLGCASLGSDVISISCRDAWIGWDKETKLGGRLNNSAIATTIVGVQPFGYNFLGGKLVASMLTTKEVREAWEKLYPQKLVGLTTTSLYGAHSMYQRIPFWKELGETTGAIMLKPDNEYYKYWHHYLKEHHAEKYLHKTEGGDGNGPATGIKQKILTMIMQELQMKQSHYQHGFNRGVFYCELYENTRPFLRGEIEESALKLNPKIKNGVDDVLNWWVPKAIARYENLYGQGRVIDSQLFYTNAIGMTWDECKKEYLGDVGR